MSGLRIGDETGAGVRLLGLRAVFGDGKGGVGECIIYINSSLALSFSSAQERATHGMANRLLCLLTYTYHYVPPFPQNAVPSFHPMTFFFALSVVSLSFVDGLLSFLFIASVRLGYVVCPGGAGIVVEGYEDGKVVGSDVGKAT